MKALRRFTVRAHLPEPLHALADLSTNLRWSWHPPTQDLFASIDPDLWAGSRDPLRLLGDIGPARLRELAEDEGFLGRLDELAADLDAYLEEPRWFQQQVASGHRFPTGIAYFSMEFGVSEVLPIYSGGLGILAGDHLKAASDLGLPLIGVGLLYRSGYFRQSLTADGWQTERYPNLDPQGLSVRTVNDADGNPVTVRVSMPDNRVLRARLWVADVGRIPLLLLDSDIPDNDTDLRGVTDRLYGGDQDHRIKQEILAGVGGVRAVREYTRIHGRPDPDVFHMNEGHAGFLGAERIREFVSTAGAGLDFDTALAAVRASTVFTTHTPVPAGIDRFPLDMVRHYFGDEQGQSTLLPGLELSRILELGSESDPGVFNMAHMGLRLGQRTNGVSKLHGAVSREMFGPLWPGFDAAQVPIGSVTNGVHAPTWSSRRWTELAAVGHAGTPDEADTLAAMKNVPAQQLWATRNLLRTELIAEVRRRLRRSGLERGFSAAELGWTAGVFSSRVLTIGFARRAATYKRLTLMLRDTERLKALLLDKERPVQLVVAGKAHPADDGGKALIQKIVRFADANDVRHRIVFLPDYDMSMARFLYGGCDVWLNNPLRPMEACGTSGMKSALNGGLNLSILDGWWDEMSDSENGWAIPTADGVTDDVRRDDLEAAALYELLENVVVPKFYDADSDGIPTRWVEMVRHTLHTLGPQVLASRMVRDYTEDYYAPAAFSGRQVTADNYGGARELAQFRRQVETSWPGVNVLDVDSAGLEDTPLLGSTMTLTAHVDLAGLQPDQVLVQAVIGRVDDEENLTQIATTTMPLVDGRVGPAGEPIFEVAIPLPMTGPIGYTVRVMPQHRFLTSNAELGVVAFAHQ
ncbi:glycogen phosphorylase [Williamsia sp. 1138]|uniref:alpha-glucan family phosphorylase n=1 Tax=Williamsia sp. 1138 TaxID=1903117 RepID=UPI000A0F92E4|nr:alpha-glucan family phosphorylase [Williamsia sp. 1138]OZG28552.1 glycogen phosphorylase [Williamsia sp. 1138]